MNPRVSSALAAIGLAALAISAFPSALSANDSTIPLTAKPVPLNPDDEFQTKVGRLLYRGGIELGSADILFGGLSGLDVAADGAVFTAISDNGRWISGSLTYHNGALVGAGNGVMKPMLRLQGYTRKGNWRDAEALAPDGSGGYFVAFERQHRIWHYRTPRGKPFDVEPIALPGPPDIESQPNNGGIEAMARLCDRRLLAISETAPADGDAASAVKAWVFDGKQWKPLSYATTDDFKPTGAATLPDCNLAVLERSFSRLRGVRARVVFVQAKTIRPGATLRGDALATLVPPVTVDNMEGIAARKGDNGETLIYLVSDNNFSGFQRTLMMMFELLPPPETK